MPRPTSQDWSGQDAAAFNQFCATRPNFMLVIQKALPRISTDRKIEERAMSGSERKGAENLFDIIEEMRKGFDNPGDKAGFIDIK